MGLSGMVAPLDWGYYKILPGKVSFPAFSTKFQLAAIIELNDVERENAGTVWMRSIISSLVCLYTACFAVPHPITSEDGEKNGPCWSPDGSKIAYQRYIPTDGHFEIYTISSTGNGTPIRITNSSFDSMVPVWSPDGMKIAFRSDRPTGSGFWLHDISTGNESFFVDGARSLCWSPDGQYIAYSRENGSETNIFKKNLSTGEEIQLTSGAEQQKFPDWSHDGNTIVFTQGSNLTTVWTISALGGSPIQVPVSYGHAPKWSPDNKKIAFWGGTDQGTYAIWIYDIHSSGLEQVSNTPMPYGCYYPDWSQDGQKIAFVSALMTSESQVWITECSFEQSSLGRIRALYR